MVLFSLGVDFDLFWKYPPLITSIQSSDNIRRGCTVTDMDDLPPSGGNQAFDGKTLDEFWVSVALEYPRLSKAALDVLMQFVSMYLCEKTFSALTYIKNKHRLLKGIGHLGEKELKERKKLIQEENCRELQKDKFQKGPCLKQLCLEQEREKSMWEQELGMVQGEKEAKHFKTWAEQEDNFHLHQAKLRSKIHIRGGRAKPIDLLAKYISTEDDDLSVEMHELYTFLNVCHRHG
ncbi:cactin-like isoform X1 [Tachysurus ichikawai]